MAAFFSSLRSLLEVVAQAWSFASVPSADVYLHESRRLVLRFVWLRATEGKDKGCAHVIQVDAQETEIFSRASLRDSHKSRGMAPLHSPKTKRSNQDRWHQTASDHPADFADLLAIKIVKAFHKQVLRA